MKDGYALVLDGQETRVSLEGELLKVGSKELAPVKAFLDIGRANPFWLVLAVITGVLLLGAIIAVLVYDAVISSIIGVAAISLCVFSYLYLYRREQVLIVEGKKDPPILLRGDPEDLSELHYRLAKLTLPRSSDGTRDDRRAKGARAGTVHGSELFKEDELAKVKDELGKRLVKDKRIISQICPQCQGNELYYESGMFGGYVYHCKKCDYVGSFVIEKEIRID